MIRLTATVLFIGLAAAVAQPPVPREVPKKDEDRRDLTQLRRTGEASFVHEAAKTTFKIPAGWKEIPPYKLTRVLEDRTSTVLGMERKDRDMVATIYWIAIPVGAKFSDWIREAEVAGEFGEEFETLKVVYGADNVTKPVKFSFTGFEVYKVNMKGGPDRGDKYDGTLYLFQVAGAEGRWLIKARVSYPKTDVNGQKWAEEVLAGYAQVEDPSKLPTVVPVPLVEEKK